MERPPERPAAAPPRRGLLAWLFSLEGRVGRAAYAAWGFGLMAGKYLIDAAVVRLTVGADWYPWEYLNPYLSVRDAALGHPEATWLQLAMLLWALPFLWIGLSLTMRRLLDAGEAPELVVLFFVPLVNYLLMLLLCLLPPAERSSRGEPVRHPGNDDGAAGVRRAGRVLRAARLTLAVGTALGMAAGFVLGERLSSYGLTLFVLVPFLVGVVWAWGFNRRQLQSARQTAGLVTLVALAVGGSLLLFAFVPLVNYLLLLLLFLVPPAQRSPRARLVRDRGDDDRAAGVRRAGRVLRAALVTLAVGTALGIAAVFVLGERLASYGWTLFVLVPFLVGGVCAWSFNRRELLSARQTAGLVTLVALAVGGSLLLFALEGALCLAMAAPLAIPLVLVGAFFGRGVAVLASRSAAPAPSLAPALLALVAVPLAGAVERRLLEPPVYEVVSVLEVDAPPEAVWPRVVSFHELPEPTWLPFRLGIAYPVRARIEGSGVGAVRRCEFSTGAFVEPITAWEPPRRLAFDVAEHPPAMHELSPWRDLAPPHLEDGFRSLRGEFRLTPLPGGGTRLEGSTWYRLRLYPSAYWRLWSDALVHRIHRRVLDQIAREATGS